MANFIKIFGFLLVVMATNQTSAADWQSYQNQRFGTSAQVPAEYFNLLPPPKNGDGRTWVLSHNNLGANQYATFSVFGSYMVVTDKFAKLQKIQKKYMTDDGIKITYSTQGKNWFVLSGTKGNRIYYRKHQLNERCGHPIVDGFSAEYTADLKSYFDPIVLHISRSLKGSQNGFGC